MQAPGLVPIQRPLAHGWRKRVSWAEIATSWIAFFQSTWSAGVTISPAVDKPVVADDQVLLRVPRGVRQPSRLVRGDGLLPRAQGERAAQAQISTVGGDVAGSVEAVGSDVHAFQPGDEVFGVAGGAWAEYACAREARLAPKPARLSFEEAAACPVAALTALQALRDHGNVQPANVITA